MKKALRVSLPVLFSVLAFGASAPLAFAATFNNPDYYYANITNAPDGTKYRQAGSSPDGTKIVAVKNIGTTPSTGWWEIVLMNTDGSGETRISAGDSGTGHLYEYSNPFWSDDGAAIGYLEVYDNAPNKLVVYNVSDGSHSYLYEPDPNGDLSINNPDFLGGSKTAVVFWDNPPQGSGEADLYTWDGTTRTNITNSAGYKEYEPVSNATGDKIVYWSGETAGEPINTTHTLTYSGGVWTKDVDFAPIVGSYWAYWTTPAATQIALTGWANSSGTVDISTYDNTGNFVADLSGPGYTGGDGQWNFFGSMPQGSNGAYVATSNAWRANPAVGRDIVIAAPRTTMYVSAAGSDLNPGTQAAPFATIQKAVSETATGGTINVAAGTYTEAGQIVINKNLSIVGAASSTVAIMTDSDTGNTGDAKGWFLVNSGNTFNVSGVTLNGTGHKVYQAIRYNGSGTIDNVRFTNIAYEQSGPQYNGGGVRIGSPGSVDVTNSTFSNMGRVGVLAEGGTGTFSGNTYTGKGAGNWLDYALDIEYGSHMTVSNNQISHNRGVASSDGSTSAAIAVWDDAGTQATVNSNTLTDNTAGVAIAVASGASDPTVTVGSGNVFDGNDIGIDIQNAGANGSPSVAITGSTFSDNTTGIQIPAGMTAANMSVHSSAFLSNATSTGNYGVGTLNAANNWWGSATSTDITATILGTVNSTPWYTSLAMTALSDGTATNASYSSPVDGQADLPSGQTAVALTDDTVLDITNSVNTVSGGQVVVAGTSKTLSSFTSGDLSGVNLTTAQTVGGQSVTVDKAVQLSSGSSGDPIVLTNSALSNVSASIPDGTTILAPAGWTGTIAPPKTGSSSGNTVPSGFAVGSAVIDVGSPDAVLLFDKPVTLVLTGVTGTVGYRPAGSSTWTRITNTCSGDYANPGSPVFPGECTINNGTDTKVLTYHFTSFASLVAASGGAGGSSGGSSSGGGSVAAVSAAPVTPAVSTVSPAIPAAPEAPAQGQVLGAAAYSFTKDLRLGSSGTDVTELQKLLIAEGFDIPAITKGGMAYGTFGGQTLSAVIAYQKAHGISPAKGYVSTLTRAELNKGTVSTTAETTPAPKGKSSLTADQANSILSVLQSFGADASVVAKVKAALGQ